MAEEADVPDRGPHRPSVLTGAAPVVRPIRSLAGFYRTQVHLLWRWSGGSLAVGRRAALIFLRSDTAFAITARIVPELVVRQPLGAAIAALVLAIVSTLARPLLIALLSGVSVILVGVGTLATQAIALVAVAGVSPDITVDGPRGA